jgi:hypothetical protein
MRPSDYFRTAAIIVSFLLLVQVDAVMKGWIRSIPSNPKEILAYSSLAIIPGLIFSLATINRAIIKQGIALPWVICWLGCTVLFPGIVTVLQLYITQYLPCTSQLALCGNVLRLSISTCIALALHLFFFLAIKSCRQSHIAPVFIQGTTFGLALWILTEAFQISGRLHATWAIDEVEFLSISVFILGTAAVLVSILSGGLLTLSRSIASTERASQSK